jgi:hypothetical protein
MTLSVAVWLVIFSALVMANLPFVLDRPLAAWGWAGPRGTGPGLRWLRCLAFLAGVALWSYGTIALVGGAFAGGGGAAGLFLVKLLVSVAVMAAWLYWPGLPGRAVASGTESSDAATVTAQAPSAEPPAQTSPVRPLAGRRPAAPVKPFIDRFLEVLVSYVLVGTLGKALELNLGNAFTQGWEFYAVTLALFLVLAYPGFVWRYMLKARRHH